MKTKTMIAGTFPVAFFAALGFLSGGLSGAVQVLQLSPSSPSPQLVGTKITWTVTATDSDPGTLDYRFAVRRVGSAAFRMARDFHPSNSFDWTPSQREGTFQIRVTARNSSTQTTDIATAAFLVTLRVTGGTPLVNPTSHPLVALYSAPSCAIGSSMRVRFIRFGAASGDVTSSKPCDANSSMNFYIAGMLPSTLYLMRHEIVTGGTTTPGPVLSFTTGVLPPSLAFPSVTQPVPANAQTSLAGSGASSSRRRDRLSSALQVIAN